MIDISLEGIGSLFTSAREAITGEKIKDPLEIAKIDLQLQELQNKLINGQLLINMEEAKHPSWFVAGWRPAVGWVGVMSLFFMYVPKAIVMTGFWCYQVYLTLTAEAGVVIPKLPMFPDLGTGDIIGLLLSILGVGAMRSFDKSKGVDTKGVIK